LVCLYSPTKMTHGPIYLSSSGRFLTPCSTVLLEQLTGSQPVKKFPTFYGSRRFITAFTSARYQSLPGASSIQSIPPYPTSWRFIPVLSHLRLGLPCGPFPSGFSTTALYAPFPIRTIYPPHLVLLDLITRIMFVEQYRSFISTLCSFLHSPVTPSLLVPDVLLNTHQVECENNWKVYISLGLRSQGYKAMHEWS